MRLFVNGSRVKTLHAARDDYIGEMWANDEYLYLVFNANHYTPNTANLNYSDVDGFRRLILRIDKKGSESLCADITSFYTFDNLFDFEEMPDPSSARFNWWRHDVGPRTMDIDLSECWESNYFSVRSRFLSWSHWKTKDMKHAVLVLSADLLLFSR